MKATRIKWDKSMVTRCLTRLPKENYGSAGGSIIEKSKVQPVFETTETGMEKENIAEELPGFPVLFNNDTQGDWEDFKVAVHIASM